MDRASDFGSEGWGFDSLRAHQTRGFARVNLLFVFIFSSFLLFAFPLSSRAQTAQLHNTAGLAKFYQGKYDEAFAEFVSALRKDPAYAAPHFNLGRLYEKQGRFEEALRQYQQTLQLDPRYEGARDAVERLGYVVAPPKEEPAPASVDEARRTDLERQKGVVSGLIVDGKLDRAEERLLVLLGAHPRDGTLHELLARVYERKSDYGRAIAELKRAEELLPDSSLVVYRLAADLYRVGNFEAAEEKARKVVGMDPANYRAHHLLGLIYRSRDKVDEAQKYFAEAARLKPDDGKVQEDLGRATAQVGHFRFNSAMFYFSQRNWKKAKEEFEGAIKQGNLTPEQLALAQQYMLIADFSSQKIDQELERIEKDRRNAERGYVQKRLTFREVERSPSIWRQGAYVEFSGRVVSVDSDSMGLLVFESGDTYRRSNDRGDTVSDENYKRDASLIRWFWAKAPKKLPDDPRIAYGALVTVQGKLAKPDYLRNPYNQVWSREPQPVVEVTYLRVESESDLSGPLKIDFLSYSTEQRGQRLEGEPLEPAWRKYQYSPQSR